MAAPVPVPVPGPGQAAGITLRGTALDDHLDVIPEWIDVFGRELRNGRLAFPRTVLSGIDQAPCALRELLVGQHVGAVHVEL
ncbi:hypothetical protein ACFC0M_21820 [Streptomyces sp. NPDC056149]|uniref:hypothetical protein n=1 Tax=Streptomyces sp. NPDC056149 TaxID=3345728 RepID=UPI0035E07FA8